MKKWILFFFFCTSLFSIEIDPTLLEEIISNDPKAYNEQLLLAKYYDKAEDYEKAIEILDDILSYKKEDEKALSFKKELTQKISSERVLEDAGFSFPVDILKVQTDLSDYYEATNYADYRQLYEALIKQGVMLNDKSHINAAYIYMWDEAYTLSQKALDRIEDKEDLDRLKISADICYFKEDFKCAQSFYTKLYARSENIFDAVKLIYSMMFLGQIQKARHFYDYLHSKYPNHIELEKISETLDTLQVKYLTQKKEAYQKEKSLKNVDAYAQALYNSGEDGEAVEILRQFNEKQATAKSLLLEARYLAWMNRAQKALVILNSPILEKHIMATLMKGKVYSWLKEYDLSEKYLKEVLNSTHDKALRFDANRALAFIYFWQKDMENAKKLFEMLYQEDSKDQEVYEALLLLNKKYLTLIKIYENKVKISGLADDVKRLSEYYTLNNQKEDAIDVLKEYLKINPNNNEIKRYLAIALIEHKAYEEGFKYLKAYAWQQNDVESKFLLAQYYYWHGFSKEATAVVAQILKENPNFEKALTLQEQIKQKGLVNGSDINSTMRLANKQLQLADKLYFSKEYKPSLTHYESYMAYLPKDESVKERYAFALEHTKAYDKATEVFLQLNRSSPSDLYSFHYGYNMMMSGKLDEAENIFKKLQKSLYQKVDTKLKRFAYSWLNAYKKRNYERFLNHYARAFKEDKKRLKGMKEQFAQDAYSINTITQIVTRQIDKNHYSLKFYQEYGEKEKLIKGYRTLYIKCEKNKTECKIFKEKWVQKAKEKYLNFKPLIIQALKDIRIYRAKRSRVNTKHTSSKKRVHHYSSKYVKKYKKHSKKYYTREEKNQISAPSLQIQQTKPQPQELLRPLSSRGNHILGGEGFIFEDSVGNQFYKTQIIYKKEKLTKNIDIALDAGIFGIGQKDVAWFNGVKYGISLYFNHFQLRLGVNHYEDFDSFIPTFKYSNQYKNHSYAFEYTRQNGLFYTYDIDTYLERLNTHHFSFTDYIYFKKEIDLWANLQVNSYSNGDTEVTGQFDWHFFYDEVANSKFAYAIALEGWYTSHSKTTSSYYSPRFADATLVRFEPKYRFSKYLTIKGSAGVGYSFSDDTIPYKFGLWIYGQNTENFHYKLGCIQNYTVSRLEGEPYDYFECSFNMDYQW